MSFNESLNELKEVLEASRELESVVEEAWAAIVHALRQGGKLLTCGNGGSAADALHLAEELVQLGVSKDDIVLGFHSPSRRKFTEYAVN